MRQMTTRKLPSRALMGSGRLARQLARPLHAQTSSTRCERGTLRTRRSVHTLWIHLRFPTRCCRDGGGGIGTGAVPWRGETRGGRERPPGRCATWRACSPRWGDADRGGGRHGGKKQVQYNLCSCHKLRVTRRLWFMDSYSYARRVTMTCHTVSRRHLLEYYPPHRKFFRNSGVRPIGTCEHGSW